MNRGKVMCEKATVGDILQQAYPDVGSAHPASYVSELGDSVQALVYSGLFWPKLVEIEGAVYVALRGDDREYVDGRLRTPAPSNSWGPMAWVNSSTALTPSKLLISFDRIEALWIWSKVLIVN